MRPVVVVTSDVPPDRVASFRALHERMPLLVARFGGDRRHATRGVDDPGVPVRDVAEREVARLAGGARAVVAGTVGRVALPAAYLGARRARVPFVLWTALWAHPRTPAHALSWPLLRHLYRHADAVVTYGDHVSAYVRARGAENVHVAPQAVDPAFWTRGGEAPGSGGAAATGGAAVTGGAAATAAPAAPFRALFVGRLAPEKGIDVLLDAWRRAGVDGELVVVGPGEPRAAAPGVTFTGPLPPAHVRNFIARASVLVMPSVATRAFREPWGLVANEAMHMNVPVIATDAVGAAAGGLVRHERNGLVVPANDAEALAAAIRRAAADDTLRQALGRNAGRDAAAFTPEAWAAGMAGAIESAELRRNR
ncbi:MAG TPA: glycosyltransferase family 4 protein [Solirubrobacteraceae bacterium]|jgi:glycosyltransferase involved in cell wall biosynthesis|nr:glycosyltransferase family 4 protein [Solirubrobacteraceae bacterium]